MKRLFFVSIFSFGMLFFVQPQIVSASACTDNRGSCVYNAAGCPSGTSQNNNYACDAGFEGLCCVPTTGDSSDSDSSSGGVDTPCVGDNKVGFSGTCQTFEACGGNPANFDSSEEDCSPGFLCCNGATGAPAGATPQSVCVGKSQNDPCIGPTFNEPGTCRAVPTASSPLSCVVNTGVPSTGGGPSTGSRGGAIITCNGIIKAGVCFPVGTGLSDTPVWLLLMRLMWWLLAVFGMIAIIAFVISGIQYLISAGNEAMIETAKRNMMYSMLGVLVGLSGWVIIRAIDAALNGWSFWYF